MSELLTDMSPAERKTFFVDVIVPAPIPQYFTYRVPRELEELLEKGKRVIVPFGRRRVVTGIIAVIHHKAPEKYEAKYVLDVLDELPTVSELQLKLWEWMAQYYMCTVGEVMNVALPSGLKLTSQSRIQLHPEFNQEETEAEFTEKELDLIEALRRTDSMPYDRAAEVLQVKNIYHILKFLIAKKAILIFEQVKEKYQPKKLKKIRLNPVHCTSEKQLEELFESLSKKPKQEAVLLQYLAQVPVFKDPALNEEGLEKQAFLQKSNSPLSKNSLGTLVKNGIFEEFEVIVSRFEEEQLLAKPAEDTGIVLSEHQEEIRDQLLEYFQIKDVALLFGVTGSGKTEVYMDLIQRALENESQVLLLLPEIALTAQIVKRMKKVFGSQVGVYHSKFSDNERVEVWQGVQDGRFPFVIGVRSSIFLPFDNLGLIIVDEEHEPSYKQYDPAPRYHARDVATVLGRMHHAKVLLGSATPSVESYFLAKKEQYGLVELTQRFGNAQMPDVEMANVQKERDQKKIKGNFTSHLLDEIGKALENGKQVILFQNRRGFAPYLTCEDCAWIPKCQNCSVSLTYHMHRNELRCHYCGFVEAPPRTCIACDSNRIKMMGVGTERIEDELKVHFPTARIQRMDLDTTRRKYSYQKIISDFEHQQIDILVGTQMVSKGLDFDHVQLVGVFDVDRMLHFPDFRSHERTFNMVTQVSGRAGRREEKGLVVVQTASPEQPILQKIADHDYEAFFQREIRERHKFQYPPFTRLIRLTLKSEDRSLNEKAAEQLAKLLKKQMGAKRVLGPETPPIDRLRNQFLINILIKLERRKVDLKKAKALIKQCMDEIAANRKFSNVQVVVDVDCL